MEINGRSTKDMTHADAIELIKQCGSSVSLLVKRGGKLPQHLGECLACPLTPSATERKFKLLLGHGQKLN